MWSRWNQHTFNRVRPLNSCFLSTFSFRRTLSVFVSPVELPTRPRPSQPPPLQYFHTDFTLQTQTISFGKWVSSFIAPPLSRCTPTPSSLSFLSSRVDVFSSPLSSRRRWPSHLLLLSMLIGGGFTLLYAGARLQGVSARVSVERDLNAWMVDAGMKRPSSPQPPSPSPPHSHSHVAAAAMIQVAGTQLSLSISLICGANILVFFLWRVLPRSVMERHFALSLYQLVRSYNVHTLLTSTISHATVGHLLFNTIGIVTIGPQIVQLIGDAQFWKFWLVCSLFSGFGGVAASILLVPAARRAQALILHHMGSSGCLMGMFAMSQWAFPQQRFSIIFLPFWPIPAPKMFAFVLFFDVCGLIYNYFRGSMMGHGAHLTGALTGLLWLNMLIHKERRKLQAKLKGSA